MSTLCIVHAPPRIARPTHALCGLVGLEFEEDYEHIARILVDHPYMPLPASFFACVDVQVVLEQLRLLGRHAALAYWTEFACCYPLLYIPRPCCQAVADYA